MREVVANQFANKDIYQKVTDYLERHNYPRLVNRDNLIISVFPEAFPELMSYPLTEGYGNANISIAVELFALKLPYESVIPYICSRSAK